MKQDRDQDQRAAELYRGQDISPYAYLLVEQNEGDITRLRAELYEIARRLFDNPRKLSKAVECVIYYVQYCSARTPNFDELSIAGRFLLAFIFLNDYNDNIAEPVFPELLRGFLAILEGFPPAAEHISGEWLAFLEGIRRDLLEKSNANRVSLSTLLHLMRQAYSAFLWEWSAKGQSISLVTFQKYRSITIFNKPWIELWRVLRGIPLDLSLTTNSEVAEVEELAAEITYIANDLFSLKKDIEKNKQNIVFLVRDHENTDLIGATMDVRKMHDRKLDRFTLLCSKLEVEERSGELTEYLSLMKNALRGNIHILGIFKQRYDASATPNLS